MTNSQSFPNSNNKASTILTIERTFLDSACPAIHASHYERHILSVNFRVKSCACSDCVCDLPLCENGNNPTESKRGRGIKKKEITKREGEQDMLNQKL
ncbi:hypothetical protein TNCV_4995461 [Trichonephila clavipes]|nr:hypothetical protein TNCV_4995461 [Trichonephila clavipes]